MASRPKHKMSPAERAKQFMPFSALRGLEEALREKEKIIVPRPELSEDAEEEIDRKLKEMKPFMKISVVHYLDGECVKNTGVVAKIDKDKRFLQIVDIIINFDNILRIDI